MFSKNSRYAGLPTVTTTDAEDREVSAVKLRRLPPTSGEATTILGHDQLDVMAFRRYRDGTRFWHVADANTELEANALVTTAGRRVDIPVK